MTNEKGIPFVCEQANLVESVQRLCNGSGYEDYIQIRLKTGQTINIEFEGTVTVYSEVEHGTKVTEAGYRMVDRVSLVEETFTQRG